MDFRFEAEEELTEDLVEQTRNGEIEEKLNVEKMASNELKMPELTQLVSQESKIPELSNFKEEGEGKQNNIWLAMLDLKKVKAAGTFLDGCKIVLLGFAENQNVHLARWE